MAPFIVFPTRGEKRVRGGPRSESEGREMGDAGGNVFVPTYRRSDKQCVWLGCRCCCYCCAPAAADAAAAAAAIVYTAAPAAPIAESHP